MSISDTLTTVGVGAASGIAGLLVMDPVTTKIQEMTPKAAKEQEKAAQPGNQSATQVVAETTAEAVGVDLTKQETKTGGMVVHYATAVAGGLLYTLLRRLLPAHPAVTGLLTGLAMFVALDEALLPALGLSGPPTAYPKETHIRGFIGHIVFGLGVAAAAEAMGWFRENVG